MAVNIETQKPPVAAAGAMSRQEAVARQDRWMLELERAAFAAGSKKRAGRQEATAGALAQALAPVDLGGDAGAQPESRIAGSSSAASGGAGRTHPEGPGQARPAAAAGERTAETAAAASQGRQARPASADGAAPALPAQLATPGGAAAPAVGQAQLAQAGAAVLPAAGDTHAGDAAPVSAVLRANRATLAGIGLAPAAPDLQQETPSSLHEPEGQAHAGSADARSAGDAEAYAKRLLHVYRGGDGVHAWIRDAGLSPAQLLSVAGALSGQFAMAGTPLAALTVNGKKVVSQSAGSRSADDDEAAAQAVILPTNVPAATGAA